MGGADRRCAAHPRICRARLCRRAVGPAGAGGAGATRGHAARHGRGDRSPARRAAAADRRSSGDRGAHRPAARRRRSARDRRRSRLGCRRRASFRRMGRVARPARRQRVPPPGCDRQRLAGVGGQSRLRSQSQTGRAGEGGGPAHRRRCAARRGDHRWLHPHHPRASRADTRPRPSRPGRIAVGLSHRSRDLRGCARVR